MTVNDHPSSNFFWRTLPAILMVKNMVVQKSSTILVLSIHVVTSFCPHNMKKLVILGGNRHDLQVHQIK